LSYRGAVKKILPNLAENAGFFNQQNGWLAWDLFGPSYLPDGESVPI
jgi:hypothetical protein